MAQREDKEMKDRKMKEKREERERHSILNYYKDLFYQKQNLSLKLLLTDTR